MIFRFNQDSSELQGWSEVEYVDHRLLGNHRQLYFIESIEQSYALNRIYTNDELIDQWLNEIIDKTESELFEKPFETKKDWLS